MAQEIYIDQWFSPEMRLAGERLVKRLHETGAEVASAFWLFDANENFWALYIISPLVATEGPKAYYKRIQDIINQAGPDEGILSLHDLRVWSTGHPLAKALGKSQFNQATQGNTRIGRSYIEGVYVADMYLYSMDRDLLRAA